MIRKSLAVAGIALAASAMPATGTPDILNSPQVAKESARSGFPFAPTRAIQIDVTYRTRAFFRAGTAKCNPGQIGSVWYCKVRYRRSGEAIATRTVYFEDGSVKHFRALVVPSAIRNLV